MKIQSIERRGASGERETRAYALSIRATGENGTVEGYGSVFGVKDTYDDIILPGAFEDSLKEHKAAGTMPAMLWQHRADEPIGVWTDMAEDKNGLHVRGQLLLTTARGREAFELLKAKALNGLSIGFCTVPGTSRWDEEGIRILSALDLWEVSLVTFPANRQARITGVKTADVAAITTIRQAEQALREAGYSADAAKAFIASVKRIALEERDVPGAAAAMKAANRLLDSLTT